MAELIQWILIAILFLLCVLNIIATSIFGKAILKEAKECIRIIEEVEARER